MHEARYGKPFCSNHAPKADLYSRVAQAASHEADAARKSIEEIDGKFEAVRKARKERPWRCRCLTQIIHMIMYILLYIYIYDSL